MTFSRFSIFPHARHHWRAGTHCVLFRVFRRFDVFNMAPARRDICLFIVRNVYFYEPSLSLSRFLGCFFSSTRANSSELSEKDRWVSFPRVDIYLVLCKIFGR